LVRVHGAANGFIYPDEKGGAVIIVAHRRDDGEAVLDSPGGIRTLDQRSGLSAVRRSFSEWL